MMKIGRTMGAGRLTSAVAVALFATMIGSAAFGQVQNKNQQKCINSLNKDICKLKRFACLLSERIRLFIFITSNQI